MPELPKKSRLNWMKVNGGRSCSFGTSSTVGYVTLIDKDSVPIYFFQSRITGNCTKIPHSLVNERSTSSNALNLQTELNK